MSQVYDYVTEAIVKQLEAGCIPWKKTWAHGMPSNFVSKKAYKGINLFLLAFAPYSSPYWLTYNQATSEGGTIRKGEKGTMVVFWKMLTGKDKITGQDKNIPLLRYYTVFNVEQCDGLTYDKADVKAFNPIESCETVLANMPQKPEVKHEQPSAFYSPAMDFINMPKANTFDNPEYYYATLFHELAHATGHVKRLNRDTVTSGAKFGSEVYSKEELVAEMASAFLCSETGILPSTISNSSAYIQGWLKKLKEDRTLLVSAASQATKASKFILGQLETVEA